ncbi:MAG: hypothetical protein LBM78_04225, partial [Clostridiales bacterium]|nr:hypothetical protein [Clostridiales bacterium]
MNIQTITTVVKIALAVIFFLLVGFGFLIGMKRRTLRAGTSLVLTVIALIAAGLFAIPLGRTVISLLQGVVDNLADTVAGVNQFLDIIREIVPVLAAPLLFFIL